MKLSDLLRMQPNISIEDGSTTWASSAFELRRILSYDSIEEYCHIVNFYSSNISDNIIAKQAIEDALKTYVCLSAYLYGKLPDSSPLKEEIKVRFKNLFGYSIELARKIGYGMTNDHPDAYTDMDLASIWSTVTEL